MPPYPNRLIEIDLPIQRIFAQLMQEFAFTVTGERSVVGRFKMYQQWAEMD